jgi:hypothetical protein
VLRAGGAADVLAPPGEVAVGVVALAGGVAAPAGVAVVGVLVVGTVSTPGVAAVEAPAPLGAAVPPTGDTVVAAPADPAALVRARSVTTAARASGRGQGRP